MSRTDVHRPWDVQMRDPYNRHRVALRPTWSTQPPEPFPLYQTCGCSMCTYRYGRRLFNRQTRVQWSRLCREWAKVPVTEADGIEDVPRRRVSAHW